MTVMTKEQFESLTPRERGYVVYLAGCRDDQPNIPDEANPYPRDTEDAREWREGQIQAVIETQDVDD